MSRWNACRALLDARLMGLPGLTPDCLSVPNKKFDPPTGKIWYAPHFMPQKVSGGIGIGGDRHEEGIYQVSVYAPAIDPLGIAPGLQAVDAICAHFDTLLSGSGLRLQCSVPVPAPMLQEIDWCHWPVSIRFIAL
jgi:hypothetical protein